MRFIYFFIALFCMASCTSKDAVPKNILNPQKMGDVLWDVMRMQYLAEEKAASDSSIKQDVELEKLTQKVFEAHQISSGTFDASYTWYLKHPAQFKNVLDSVQAQKQREYNEQIGEEEEAIPDHEGIKERVKEKRFMREIQ